ncbi:hypothetical protein [Spongiimicrobium salis]|uniref:hypothetical protein n=1 Tax=Spongiimicrobium salis TaxID=1667022 RepID=UPI00374D0DA4
MISLVFGYVSKLLEHPYVNLVLSIGLIAVGVEQIYKHSVPNLDIHWKHGIGIYGILMFLQSFFKIVKGGVKIYHGTIRKKPGN